MLPSKTYENFPAGIVMVSDSVTVLLWAAGFIIMLKFSPIAGFVYLAYLLVLEYRLLSRHCVNCWYYGKTCGFGQGRLSAILFKKGNPERFCAGSFTWKDMVPDLMVSMVPVITGIALIAVKFDLLVLVALVLLILLTTVGNSMVRGNFACKYCRQREHGCPAEKLFSKEKAN